MLTASVLSTLLLLLSSSPFTSAGTTSYRAVLAARKVHASRPRSFHRALISPRNRRRDANPVNLSPGSLTAAEGCTNFHVVASGENCYGVAEQFGISLETFNSMNPEVDSGCLNLNAGYAYCVAQTTTSSSSSSGIVKSTAANVALVSSTSTAQDSAVTVNSLAKANARVVVQTTTAAEDDTESEYDDCGEDEEDETTTSASATPETQIAVIAAAVKTKATTTTASTSAQAVTTTSSTSTSTSSNILSGTVSTVSALGITGFLGVNGANNNAIGSWFHTDSTTDSTNGHSWCGFPYSDNIPGFAPSVGTMLSNFGQSYEAAATAYCGLEAKLTLADGTTKLIYIADGFDDTWVLTPGSIDIVYGTFMELYGSDTSNKDIVFQNIKWEFTGNRDERLVYKGVGSAGF